MIQIRRSALVGFTPAQMFALVADVEAYPTRFPWCVGAQLIERDGDVATARLDLRWAGLAQSFTTRNRQVPPEHIQMQLVEGPFKSLSGDWTFTPLGEEGCKVALALDFEVASRLAAPALRFGFQKIADRLVDDFVGIARVVYGRDGVQ